MLQKQRLLVYWQGASVFQIKAAADCMVDKQAYIRQPHKIQRQMCSEELYGQISLLPL